MHPTSRTEAVAKDLLRRYLRARTELRRAGNYEALQCYVKLDRMEIIARELPVQELGKIPGYRAKKPTRLWRQLYREVTRIYGTDSVREIIIESAPNAGWLAKFRITVIPRDETGLLLADLCLILELIPHFTIVLVEMAFDFPIQSVVDTSFVRQHLLCGKTWLRAGGNALHERWGNTRSSKVVRAYAKFEASSFRIELQLHSRFLRKHQISHAYDFSKLATILPRHHVHFASLDDGKLREHLRRSSLSHKTKTEILKTVAKNRKSLWTTLRLLRRKWCFANVRRLIAPLSEMNGIVVSALNRWAKQWQATSSLRGMDKTKEEQSE